MPAASFPALPLFSPVRSRKKEEAAPPPPSVPWDDAEEQAAFFFSQHQDEVPAVIAAVTDALASRMPGSVPQPLKAPTLFVDDSKLAVLLSPAFLFRLPPALQCEVRPPEALLARPAQCAPGAPARPPPQVLEFLARCMQARLANADAAARVGCVSRVFRLLTLLEDESYPVAPSGEIALRCCLSCPLAARGCRPARTS